MTFRPRLALKLLYGTMGCPGAFLGVKITQNAKNSQNKVPRVLGLMVRPAGIEPALPAPEAGALSPELRAHMNLTTKIIIT